MTQKVESILLRGDCLSIMPGLPDNSFDTVITDPPYGLSFMGRKWDYDVPSVTLWKEVLRVLKPGGTMLCFAGSRTQHRMAVNVEDAGWEIRDTLFWVYGSGFPKALDISKSIDADACRKDLTAKLGRPPTREEFKAAWEKRREVIEVSKHGACNKPNGNSFDDDNYEWKRFFDITAPATAEAALWDGWKTALKPAVEPILVCMKPIDGTFAENALKWGVAGLNIDGGRIGVAETGEDKRLGGKGSWKTDKAAKNVYEGGYAGNDLKSSTLGRFPANLILDGSAEVLAVFPETGKSNDKPRNNKVPTGEKGIYGKFEPVITYGHSDSGSAARFFQACPFTDDDRIFYTAKAGKNERFFHLTCNCETVKLCLWQKQAQNQNVPMDTTLRNQGIYGETEAENSSFNTSPSGKMPTGQSLTEKPCTILTGTNRIIDSKTCNSLPLRSINESTGGAGLRMGNGSSPVVFVGDIFHLLPNTFICPPKDGRFTGVVVGATSPLSSNLSSCAACGQKIIKVSHPTQKPVSLMEYLCRLTKTPTGGLVLDPFAGSGTTGVAALNTGRHSILIEKEPEYWPIIEARLAKAGTVV